MTQLAIEEIRSGAKCISMKLLMNQVELARDKGKYCVIFDKNGNCPIFFKHKHTIRPLHKEIIAVTAGKITKVGALETLRAGLVHSMRLGDVFCINMGKLAPDFKNEWKDDKLWPVDEIFDFDEWREDEKYMKIVKEEENKDLHGGKGNYILAESHQMVFLSTYTSDEHMVEVM